MNEYKVAQQIIEINPQIKPTNSNSNFISSAHNRL